MIDFAWSEFIILAIIALVFLGPKEMIILFRTLGRWAAKLRLMQQTLHAHFHAASMEFDQEENLKKSTSDETTPHEKTYE